MFQPFSATVVIAETPQVLFAILPKHRRCRRARKRTSGMTTALDRALPILCSSHAWPKRRNCTISQGEGAAMIRVQEQDFDIGAEIADLRKGRTDAGAIAAFIGTVRGQAQNDEVS